MHFVSPSPRSATILFHSPTRLFIWPCALFWAINKLRIACGLGLIENSWNIRVSRFGRCVDTCVKEIRVNPQQNMYTLCCDSVHPLRIIFGWALSFTQPKKIQQQERHCYTHTHVAGVFGLGAPASYVQYAGHTARQNKRTQTPRMAMAQRTNNRARHSASICEKIFIGIFFFYVHWPDSNWAKWICVRAFSHSSCRFLIVLIKIHIFAKFACWVQNLNATEMTNIRTSAVPSAEHSPQHTSSFAIHV